MDGHAGTPGKRSKLFVGRMARVPEMVTGSMGIWRSRAILKAPFLKWPSFPSVLRVPSGKKMTDVPPTILVLASLIEFRAAAVFDRSIKIWPTFHSDPQAGMCEAPFSLSI